MRRKINFVDLDIEIQSAEVNLYTIMQEKNSTQATAVDMNGDFHLISIDDAKNRKLVDYNNILTNQSDILRGSNKKDFLPSSAKNDFLLKEQMLMKEFFVSEFDNNKSMAITYYGEDVRSPDYIIFNNFPLPDYFVDEFGEKRIYSPDKEDILIVISEYPENGPYGVHIKKSSPNLSTIDLALQGHKYSNAIGHPDDVSGLTKRGWVWLCFHYKDKQWCFNFNNIKEGDCLTKYIENLYLCLSGKGYQFPQ